MTSPAYSALFTGFDLSKTHQEVSELLHKGVKVYWLGKRADVESLREEFDDFANARLLIAFQYQGNLCFRIDDGIIGDKREEFDDIAIHVPMFNSGQYLVEHSPEHYIEVKASAGTGKTSVMADRILFLIMTGKADPSEISMITFTNEATNQMGQRLQSTLVDRYKLTHLDRFLRILEQTSEISISTIDSFSLRLLQKYGVNIGFSQDVSVGSYKQEMGDIVIDIIDRNFDNRSSVKAVLGTRLYDAKKLFENFNERLMSMGIGIDEVNDMDWGIGEDSEAQKLQKFLKIVLNGMGCELNRRKRRNDKSSLSSLVFDVDNSMSDAGVLEKRTKYLFIDEFQDTNSMQINLISSFVMMTGSDLFVVGDQKQSIYRFRGADDSAFSVLNKQMDKEGCTMKVYELVNNYRTNPALLDSTVCIYNAWVRNNMLDCFDRPIPCNDSVSGDSGLKVVRADNRLKPKLLSRILRDAIADAQQRHPDEPVRKDNMVALIVRTNSQLDQLIQLCESQGIVCISDRDEPLYKSEAVRDFFSMINSHIYCNEPAFMFDFLMSPYANVKNLDVMEMFDLDGDRALLSDYLSDYIDETDWDRYHTRFMNEPSLSVIRDMLNELPVIDNYVAYLKSKGVKEDLLKSKARKYQLNLDKLMGIIFGHFSGNSASLFRISEFLKLMIATNREETEAEVDPENNEATVYCLTVHKAKGLEFDTVILPYDYKVDYKEQSEILVSTDRKKVGWKFYKKNANGDEKKLENSNYQDVHYEDVQRTKREEVRILYVAMTRAKHKLIVFQQSGPYKPNEMRWSSLYGGIGE